MTDVNGTLLMTGTDRMNGVGGCTHDTLIGRTESTESVSFVSTSEDRKKGDPRNVTIKNTRSTMFCYILHKEVILRPVPPYIRSGTEKTINSVTV